MGSSRAVTMRSNRAAQDAAVVHLVCLTPDLADWMVRRTGHDRHLMPPRYPLALMLVPARRRCVDLQ